ncbi:MAG: hypothetical protein N2114_02730 [Candidatus Goldbacteria bacterium]|nr:hypothetical protein [Candidatus Goldiibacteriota bacterium]
MEENKEVKKEEHTPVHEIPKKVIEKQKHPWEHFKQTQNFKKNLKAHSQQYINRRISGK